MPSATEHAVEGLRNGSGRCIHLFPAEVVAQLRDHPPAMLIWNHLGHRVALADGPERILGEWWRDEAEASLIRDDYRVETKKGERFWLFREGASDGGAPAWAGRRMTPELQVSTHFSLLRGGSSPEVLFATAAALGIPALGVVDRNSVGGLVRALEASEATGVRLIAGCRIDLVDGPPLLLYPIDRAGHGRMCRLLSLGKSRAGKGGCNLSWADLDDWREGPIAILVTREADAALPADLGRPRDLFGDRAYCALTRRF